MVSMIVRRKTRRARSRSELLRTIAHERVCEALRVEADCAAQLQAGTTTRNTDDGVIVQVEYRCLDDWKKRRALYENERAAIETRERCLHWWQLCAMNEARRRAAQLSLERMVRDHAAKEVRDEMNVRELHRAHRDFLENDCTESRRRHARPLAVCRASNAPNGVSVSSAALHVAAMSAKEVATT
jgi:hypothetical protein